MSSYDHELQSLIPVLNDLERTLAQQEAANDRGQMTGSIRRMTGNESGRRSEMRNIEERLELLEDRIEKFNPEPEVNSSMTEIPRTGSSLFNNFNDVNLNKKRYYSSRL